MLILFHAIKHFFSLPFIAYICTGWKKTFMKPGQISRISALITSAKFSVVVCLSCCRFSRKMVELWKMENIFTLGVCTCATLIGSLVVECIHTKVCFWSCRDYNSCFSSLPLLPHFVQESCNHPLFLSSAVDVVFLWTDKKSRSLKPLLFCNASPVSGDWGSHQLVIFEKSRLCQ